MIMTITILHDVPVTDLQAGDIVEWKPGELYVVTREYGDSEIATGYGYVTLQEQDGRGYEWEQDAWSGTVHEVIRRS
jgi:hypothetical protein